MRAFHSLALIAALTVAFAVPKEPQIAGTGCSAAQTRQVVQDLTPVGACVLNQVGAGNVDPMSVVASCIGATIDAAVQVVEVYLAQAPQLEAGTSTRLDPYRVFLQNAKALQAKGAMQ